MGFKEKVDEACVSVGMSRTKLARILGKTQTGFNKTLNIGKFRQTDLTEIGNALGVKYHSEFEFEDGLKISVDGKESLLEDIQSMCLHKGIALSEVAMALGYETEKNFVSRLTKGRFAMEDLETIAELLGCVYVCEFDIQENSSQIAAENFNTAVANEPEKVLTEEEIKRKEEFRLRKNARQREYLKRSNYKASRKYNEKTYEYYAVALRRLEDADCIEYLRTEKEKGHSASEVLKRLIRKEVNNTDLN